MPSKFALVCTLPYCTNCNCSKLTHFLIFNFNLLGEAKSLPSKSCRILPGCPNTYCVINLDKEELFETEIVYRSPRFQQTFVPYQFLPIIWHHILSFLFFSPFFSEQFEFEIPRAFWTIGFHLITTDTTFSITNISTIGKVSLPLAT